MLATSSTRLRCRNLCVRFSRYASGTPSSHASPNLPPPRLNYKDISANVVSKTTNALNRKAPIPPDAVQSVARNYTEHNRVLHALNSKRNARSIIGERIQRCAKENDSAGKEAALLEAKAVKAEISQLESALTSLEEQLLPLALAIPNDTHPSSPLGPEEKAKLLSTSGPPPQMGSTERDHVGIGRALGIIDLESGAAVTGSSWYYLVNEAALLEIALTNYALAIAIKHGFTPVTTPDVVRSDIATRCGFQPRDTTFDPPIMQSYHLQAFGSSSIAPLILSGTAEIPLAGMFANKIFPSQTLPLKVVGLGRAFRAEAGAHGADTRGLYRVHQFTKLELFSVTDQESSEKMMQEMAGIQTKILEGLGLSFRILDMPTEELGASAYRKYDMEAWMPGRNSWGEVSSLSNCTDYQARRLHIRYSASSPSPSTAKPSPSGQSFPFAHTLNGTAAAIPRLIVALIENGAQFDAEGKVIGIVLPHALKPFWLGQDGPRNIIQWEGSVDLDAFKPVT